MKIIIKRTMLMALLIVLLTNMVQIKAFASNSNADMHKITMNYKSHNGIEILNDESLDKIYTLIRENNKITYTTEDTKDIITIEGVSYKMTGALFAELRQLAFDNPDNFPNMVGFTYSISSVDPNGNLFERTPVTKGIFIYIVVAFGIAYTILYLPYKFPDNEKAKTNDINE